MAAGWHHATGDPVPSLRYWDGHKWVGDPVFPASSDVGPNALADKKPMSTAKKWVLGVLAAFVALVVLAAIAGSPPEDESVTTSAIASVEADREEPAASQPTAAPEPTAVPDPTATPEPSLIEADRVVSVVPTLPPFRLALPSSGCIDVTTYDGNRNNDMKCTRQDGSVFYTDYSGAREFEADSTRSGLALPSSGCIDVTTYDGNRNNDMKCTRQDGSVFYTDYSGAREFEGDN